MRSCCCRHLKSIKWEMVRDITCWVRNARLENPPNLPAWIDSGGPRRASTGLRWERVVVWCKTFARPSGSKALQPHNVTQPEIQQVSWRFRVQHCEILTALCGLHILQFLTSSRSREVVHGLDYIQFSAFKLRRLLNCKLLHVAPFCVLASAGTIYERIHGYRVSPWAVRSKSFSARSKSDFIQ